MTFLVERKGPNIILSINILIIKSIKCCYEALHDCTQSLFYPVTRGREAAAFWKIPTAFFQAAHKQGMCHCTCSAAEVGLRMWCWHSQSGLAMLSSQH